MTRLSDDALVVRGGENLPRSFLRGAKVKLSEEGQLAGVSVNSADGLSVDELTAPSSKGGYPGIPHKQIGVTTVGKIRAAGGDVVPSPSKSNVNHATLSGLTVWEASDLFRPTQPNPRIKLRS